MSKLIHMCSFTVILWITVKLVQSGTECVFTEFNRSVTVRWSLDVPQAPQPQEQY